MIRPLYDFDRIEEEDAPETAGGGPKPFDARARRETWADMIRLQEQGVDPAAFAAIEAPVLMLHGAYDPHPAG